MKKIIMILVIALAVTMAVSAQNYTVQEISGRVEREAGSGKWEAVQVGETLNADTVIRTVIGSNLTLKSGDDVLVVGPMKNGKLSEVAGSGSVIQVGRVSSTNTSAANREVGRVSTASARASDAASDAELAE
ncbi:MAG: hypothetical protein LBU66_04100 [Treponema sp.]|jgi:hypothetical protein|nr:hypothetical protein [Treponema sp.]